MYWIRHTYVQHGFDKVGGTYSIRNKYTQHTPTHIYTHTHTNKHTHTYTHTHTHTDTHKHTHTHSHTHIFMRRKDLSQKNKMQVRNANNMKVTVFWRDIFMKENTDN